MMLTITFSFSVLPTSVRPVTLTIDHTLTLPTGVDPRPFLVLRVYVHLFSTTLGPLKRKQTKIKESSHFFILVVDFYS